MFKTITVDNKDYKLEFVMEASLCRDCTEKITNLMFNLDSGSSAQDSQHMEQLLKGFSDLSNTALMCFYAGLLEHHGTEEGDGTIKSPKDAKHLVKLLFNDENSGINNWYDILTMCIDQMGEDGFFERIGLSSMFEMADQRAPKKPQDHKKKVTKLGEK